MKDFEEITSGKDDPKEVVSEMNLGIASCTDNIVEN